MTGPKLPTPEEIQAAMRDFGSQTDRGAAIIAVSILEPHDESVGPEGARVVIGRKFAKDA